MRYLASSLLLLLVLAASQPAAAQGYRAREGVEAGQVQSLDRILSTIRRSRPGQLSDVQGPFGPSGEPRYRIKWLTPDGRVLWLDTDARTGQVLGVQGDERPRPGPAPTARQRDFRQNEPPRDAAPAVRNRDDDRGARGRNFDFGNRPGFDRRELPAGRNRRNRN
jgi:hypothetical protein